MPVVAATRRAASPRATPDATRASTSVTSGLERVTGSVGHPEPRPATPNAAPTTRTNSPRAGMSPLSREAGQLAQACRG